MWFKSLRARLLLLSTLVSLSTLGLVAIYSSRVTRVQMQRVISEDARTNWGEAGAQLLREHYQRHGGWTGVEPLLDRFAATSARRAILADAAGKPIASAPAELRGDEVTINSALVQIRRANVTRRFVGIRPVEIDAGAGKVGLLYVLPPEPQWDDALQRSAHTSIGQSLVWGVIVAAVLALALIAVLSRQILRPVRALNDAVRKMEGGNLTAPITVDSADEIGELARSFNSMAASLRRIEQQRRDMTNDIAHELRSPLTSIRCQLDSLEDGVIEFTPGLVAKLQREVRLLTTLIEDLEKLALAEAGQLPIEPRQVNVQDEVLALVDSVAPRILEKRIALSRSVPGAPTVYADPQCVHQILRNLLNNAVFHTPTDGKIDVTAHSAGDFVEIAIADSGPGIPPEHLPHIWERFYRTDPSRARSTGGSGLGLAIVRQLVELNGGVAGVESRAGDGSRFWVRLPSASMSEPAG